MTAASPPCSPTNSSSHSSPACLPACRRHLRRTGALRIRLHPGSGPGVWLLLGVLVVLVGLSVAVAGYVSAGPKPGGGRGSTHVDRMKLAGPVVMGLGLFIFICAATLLYENRDREVLRTGTPDDLEDLKGGSCWEDSQDQQWGGEDGEPACWASPAHILPLGNPPLPAPSSRYSTGPSLPNPPPPPPPPPPPAVDGKDQEEEEEGGGRSTLLARVLHHQEPVPHPSSPHPSVSRSSIYSDSCNSSEINFNIRTDSSELH